jgi:serine/threonine-protein kinase
VLSPESGERRVLMPGGESARYLRSGYLVYSRQDDLFAVPWRPEQADLAGAAPIALGEHPRTEGEGAAAYAFSDDGTLAYVAGSPSRYVHRLVWVDRDGTTQPLPLPERDYESVVISPDGRQAIAQIAEGSTGLWMFDLARPALAPFVTGGGSSQAPVWTADGRRVIYRATRSGTRNLFWKAADGSGEEERLTSKEGALQTPTSVSSDGTWVFFNEISGPTRRVAGLWKMRLDGDRTPQRSVEGEERGSNACISPDGRWIAYAATESGVQEVVVRPYPGPGARRQISNGGGSEPRWSRDGRELFYVSGDRLMVVEIGAGPTFAASEPRVLFEGRYRGQVNANTPYDVSPDGRRFLRVQQVAPDRPLDHVEFVLNWGDEVKRRTGGKP